MQKTKKSIAKRYKLTASGKIMRRTPGRRHLLTAKTSQANSRAGLDKQVAKGQARAIKKALPHV